MRQLLTPNEDAELERPSACHGPRFGWDQRIRSVRGFVKPQRFEIKGRPNVGEPFWIDMDDKTTIYFHTDLLRKIDNEHLLPSHY